MLTELNNRQSEDLAEAPSSQYQVPAASGLRSSLPSPSPHGTLSLLEGCVTARHLILFLSDPTNATHEG